ncbi:serine-rich coiled-coil domain-containing protein 1 [Boleophthalmus pectinirostris]|uniref:serine-rich coiled-coil domain-containing protein 1 n=1 Tax=Boleophthalmus pectinirostris TaxID=150288 RepID=UPI002432D1E2|nr:serine-rich coiled-coil domain-containing protein 1 [Boleophthalmus pectinirostris]XP_055017245.1 serine-rich coiled-coil domain-containing protein 1 [Boleophthalmus pectinirostris]
MGESGRRSTLVSRLPIFRRSSSKRQDSLPSSPSSGGLTNGVHTSSPSSTNSSSGSTGKRRSIFRAPSLGFSSKRNSEPRDHNVNLNLSSAPPANAQATDANGNSQSNIPTSVSTTGFVEGGGRSKNRHSFGFGSHKQKKITRSQTEDFDKASSSSSSAGNRNVFINCISGSRVNEGDDSGFMDDFSGASNNNKRSSSSRQKKQLLPKSFSAHHRFSKTSDHHRPPEVTLEPPSSTTTLTPGSWPGELTGAGAGGESSLQSPMISEDRTTAITPSEFHPITEDSVSDSVDVLPTPSPVPVLPPESATLPGQDETNTALDPPPAPENNNTVISTSQVFFSPVQSSAEKALPADTSTANNTDYETAVSLSEPETAVPCLPLKEQSEEERREREEERKEAREEASVEERREVSRGRRVAYLTETSESEPCVVRSEGAGPERRTRTTRSFQEPRGTNCGCQEPRHAHLRKHAGSLCSSVSPYHGVMRLERRLRSSSEGAGGPHLHGNLRDVPGLEGYGLLKHRHNSSSSKLGSLDVLNNLGSSELDEDDLMLDLELSDDQRHRHVSRENSSQSLASCLNLPHSPLDPTGERILGREHSHREASRPSSLLPAEGNSGPAVGREEEPLAVGMESLPLRLMQQDCTAVKTLLLRLKRTLQESAETSPASSLQSLPISPCSEKSLPFKDSGREEALLQQLREKDELILKLQAELESARAALKIKDCQMSDRTTQTEHAGPETNPPGRWSGAGNNSNSSSSLGPRERRAARATAPPHAGDHVNQHAPHHPPHGRTNTAREERHHQAPPSTRHHAANAALLASTFPPSQPSRGRQFEVVSSSAESLTQSAPLSAKRGDAHPPAVSQIPRAVGSSASSSLHSLSRGTFSSSDPSSPPPPTPSSSSSSSSSFTGRLGQPPRGPLSLHSYSRKNVFLQHSLQTAELQALTQRDS